MLIKFLKDASGATAIEYSFLAAMTGIIAITAITTLGGSVDSLHNGMADQVVAAIKK